MIYSDYSDYEMSLMLMRKHSFGMLPVRQKQYLT